MITFITGMPGDGKTMFAVAQIIKRLVETERYVVTNIALNRAELHAHVSKLREARYKRQAATEDGFEVSATPTFSLDERLCQITDQEAYEFFRFRSGGHLLPSSPDMSLEDGGRKMPKKEHDVLMRENFRSMRAAGDAACKPCDYFIDEVHEIFPSREWDKGGRGILYYASKHRHLHDEIFLITQQIDQVEKQLRNLASETIVCRNHIRRNVGIWKAEACFKLKFFYGLPGGPNAKPFMEPKMKLDLAGTAKCYKTTGALGVHDKPEAVQNKGILPYWTMWAAGALAVAVLVAGFVGLPYAGAMVSKRIVGSASAEAAKIIPGGAAKEGDKSAGSPAVEKVAAVVGEATRAEKAPSAAKARDVTAPVPGVTVRGYVVRGGRVNVMLSDGRVLTEKDRELEAIERNHVVVSGQRIWMARPASSSRAIEASGNAKETEVPAVGIIVPHSGEAAFPMSSSLNTIGVPGALNSPGSSGRK